MYTKAKNKVFDLFRNKKKMQKLKALRALADSLPSDFYTPYNAKEKYKKMEEKYKDWRVVKEQKDIMKQREKELKRLGIIVKPDWDPEEVHTRIKEKLIDEINKKQHTERKDDPFRLHEPLAGYTIKELLNRLTQL